MERDVEREYEPDPEDERVEPLIEDDEQPAPPPTMDPEERVEAADEDDVIPDEDRPA